MRAARFEVSTKLLETLLQMPATARIIGADMEIPLSGVITLVVDDRELPEADEPHECWPTLTEHHTEWKWNVE